MIYIDRACPNAPKYERQRAADREALPEKRIDLWFDPFYLTLAL